MALTTDSVILFVVNPISGDRDKKDHDAAIKKYFQPLSFSIHFFLLDGKNDAEKLEEQINTIKPHVVVAVGGDGTVTLVAKQLLDTDIQLGIVPAGSANGLARELDIPIDIEQALEIIEKGTAKKADAIRINGQICLHLSDIGMNARLIKYFEEGNMRGKWGYAKVALKVLLKKQNIRLVITAKDKEIARNAFMVVIANASKYGTGVVINPNGDLYDGLFEVVIIRHIGILTLLKVWFMPKSLDPKKVECFQATEVHIKTSRKADFQIDGEYIGKVKQVDATILPAKLSIILPGQA